MYDVYLDGEHIFSSSDAEYVAKWCADHEDTDWTVRKHVNARKTLRKQGLFYLGDAGWAVPHRWGQII